jgi:hypothetical protein
MHNEEAHLEPTPVHENNYPTATFNSTARIRTAMLVVAAVLGLASVVSLGWFVYQAYRFWATAGLHVPTTIAWPAPVGHFIRGIGSGLLCWQLTKLAKYVNVAPSAPAEIWPRQRVFWYSCAWTLSALAIFGMFEFAYSWHRDDRYEFFRPEFESGYVEIRPDRIEFRRASEAPVAGWVNTPLRDSDKELFVSPAVEISGRDIRRAIVRIAEVFPGSQAVELRVQFTDEGAARMERFTKSQLTNPLAVMIDGELRAAPRVFSPISRDAQLNNVFTLEEAAAMIRDAPAP